MSAVAFRGKPNKEMIQLKTFMRPSQSTHEGMLPIKLDIGKSKSPSRDQQLNSSLNRDQIREMQLKSI